MSMAATLVRSARCRRPAASTLSLHSRYSSSDSHAYHDEYHDNVQYAKEGFSSTFWRNTVLLSLFAVGFYKFAPEPGDGAYITQWLAKFSTPREVWESRNARHLVLVQQASVETLLTADARRPRTHRYRYPQSFEQKSPHLLPVGGDVDLTDLVVKGDKD